jgi:ribosomal protein L7/L12
MNSKFENIVSAYRINADDAAWLRSFVESEMEAQGKTADEEYISIMRGQCPAMYLDARKLYAVKRCRQLSGMNLTDCKKYIEMLMFKHDLS